MTRKRNAKCVSIPAVKILRCGDVLSGYVTRSEGVQDRDE
jgi:hypothetical protein